MNNTQQNEDDSVDTLLQSIIDHIHNNPILHTSRLRNNTDANGIWINDTPTLQPLNSLRINIPRINNPNNFLSNNSLFDPRTLTFGDLESDEEDTSTSADDNRNNIISSHDNSTQTDSDTCCVCYNHTSYLNIVNTPCNHNVCSTCFFRWIRTNPTCPMCRLDFTSWDRLSADDFNTELSSINELYNSVLYQHNKLLCEKKNLEKEVKEMNSILKDVTQHVNRRRKFTDLIRGYNHAIMIGNNDDPFLSSNIDKKSYVDGYRKGLKERNYFLDAMNIKKTDFLNYYPKKVLYDKIIKDKRVVIIKKRPNIEKKSEQFLSDTSDEELTVYPNNEVIDLTQENTNST